jgi:general secretion pathway protein E/type IV pilus assembly protein PilB
MLQMETSFPFYKAIGCKECFYTGYQGRKAIYEVIKLDEHLSEAIRKNELHIEAYLQKEGITTLKDAALTLLRDGNTSLEEVLPIVNE